MKIKLLLSASLLINSTCFLNHVSADTSLTFTDTMPNGATRTSNIQVHNHFVRSSRSDSTVYTLFDTEKQIMYTINPEVKQYMQANMESIKNNVKIAMQMQEKIKAQMKEQIKTMPEEQRKMIEKQMEQADAQAKMPAPKIEMKFSDKTDTVQGLSCKMVTFSVNGKAIKESCFSKEGIDEKDMAQLKKMFNFMEAITTETAKIRGLPAPDTSSMPSHQEGIAIRVRALPTGIKSELSNISTGSLDDANFKIPEGFKLFTPSPAGQVASE